MSPEILASSLKVITVDDSPVIAARLKLMISEISQVYYVGNACKISQAREWAEEHQPDFTILYIHLVDDLPHATGINLLAELRGKYPRMIIIMFTNLSEPQYRHACLSLGADYFMDKSSDFEKIPEVIEKLILSH